MTSTVYQSIDLSYPFSLFFFVYHPVHTYDFKSSFNLLTIQRLYRNQLTGCSSESVVRKLHHGADMMSAAFIFVCRRKATASAVESRDK